MNFVFKNFPEFKTKRLLLREANFKDINSVFELRSSKEINKFVGTKRVQNLEEAKDFIEVCKSLYQKEKRIFWLIEYQNQVIGSVVLHQIDIDKNYAEIGYKLKPEFHKKGIMTEAMQSVLTFGKSKMKLKTIEAFTHKNNLASIALLEKLDFVFQPNRKCKTYDFNRIYKLEIK
ncbi:GNAT family N-acetyltransferase [Polaribacter sp. Asnod6-C07]|uniref:GNAT family N-acetyltransferase n=1 Tax=Polaribacter sp. Asnod6-C07 TaxID=3160582 RepID=UPI003863B5C1